MKGCRKRTDLVLEGWELEGQYVHDSFGDYALEWDLSDREWEELLRKQGMRCPVCGAELTVDDGVVHCEECDWVLG